MKLHKSIKKLKQSQKNWNTQLKNGLLAIGYTVDYINDGIIVLSADNAHISDIVDKLYAKYDM